MVMTVLPPKRERNAVGHPVERVILILVKLLVEDCNPNAMLHATRKLVRENLLRARARERLIPGSKATLGQKMTCGHQRSITKLGMIRILPSADGTIMNS